MTEDSWALHDARWFAAHGEWPPMLAPSRGRLRAREVADELVRALKVRGVDEFCRHEFEVVRGEGRHA